MGKSPFSINNNGELSLKFSPILKSELFTKQEQKIEFGGKSQIVEKDCFAFKLFSKTLVVYHNPGRKDTFNKNCMVNKIVVTEGVKKCTIENDNIKSPLAQKIREAKVDRIDIYLK
jgi:hypothetical protein